MNSYKDIIKTIRLSQTKFEKIYNILTACIVICITIFIIINWQKIPRIIPTHYDALGRVDDKGSKWLVLIFPILTVSILSVTKWFIKHPEWGNYPKRVNQHNAASFYLINRQLLTAMNNGIIILFSFISLEMVLVGLKKSPAFINLNTVAVSFFILFFVPMLLFALKSRKIK